MHHSHTPYHIKAIAPSGERLHIRRNAASKASIINALATEGITVLHCKKINVKKNQRRITPLMLTSSLQQLVQLLYAGINLEKSLDVLIKESKHLMLSMLFQKIADSLAQGLALSDALSEHPHYFDANCCILVASGEQTNEVPHLLECACQQREKTHHIKQQVAKALFYPGISAAIALCISLFLILFIVPQFRDIFASMGATLPWPTQIILWLSLALKLHCLWIVSVSVVLFLIALKVRKQPFLRTQLQKIICALPILRHLIKEKDTTLWSYLLGALLQAGMPMQTALTYATTTISIKKDRHAYDALNTHLSHGHNIVHALKNEALLTSADIALINIGVNTASLGKMLLKISSAHEAMLTHYIERMTKWVEPLFMLGLAIIIGGLIIAMYLPIFQMGGAL